MKTNEIVQKPMTVSKGNFTQIGITGYRRYGGTVYEEFLTALQGQQGIRVYREMRENDPIIGAGMLAIEQLICSVPWFVEPTSKKPRDVRAANFLKTCMDDMSHQWHSFIENITTCLTYGWAFFEVVYKIRRSKDTSNPKFYSRYNDGKIGWRKIELRSQSSLDGWEIDETDNGIRGMWQSAPPHHDKVFIPIEKGILFRTKAYANNPEGKSMLRNAYRSWYIKKHIEEIEAVGVERDLIGMPVLTAPEGVDLDSPDPDTTNLRLRIQQLLTSFRRDEQDGIALPFGWVFSVVGAGQSTRRQFDVDRIINRWDKRIAASLLAQFIMLGMDRVGSFALSRNQNDLFLIAVQGHLENIADTINRFLVTPLMMMNREFQNLEEFPQIIPGKVSKEQLDTVAGFFSKLGSSGFIRPSNTLARDLIRSAGFGDTYNRRTSILDGGDPSVDVEGQDNQPNTNQNQNQPNQSQQNQPNTNTDTSDTDKNTDDN